MRGSLRGKAREINSGGELRKGEVQRERGSCSSWGRLGDAYHKAKVILPFLSTSPLEGSFIYKGCYGMACWPLNYSGSVIRIIVTELGKGSLCAAKLDVLCEHCENINNK